MVGILDPGLCYDARKVFSKTFYKKLIKFLSKVRSFWEHSFVVLSSIRIMIIFNNTSADFVLISADVLLKIIICNFDKTEDRATVFRKLIDFSFKNIIYQIMYS